MTSRFRDLAASTPEMIAAFGDETLLEAALQFEAALALAQAQAGLMTGQAADAIAAACKDPPDIEPLAAAASHAGTLAIPLVDLLRARVSAASGAEIASLVHRGATSQDLADTALMLQAKAGMAFIERDLARLQATLAKLAREHAETPMTGRTLLQAAMPISFGLKAAGWLQGVDEAAARLQRERSAIRLQFGGAVGAFTGLKGKGAQVAHRLGALLGLEVPVNPWHTRREGVAGLGCALAILTGALGKMAGDIALLAQTEVSEAFEPRLEGRGGSSAMAHKRNPTGCQVALSAAVRAPHLAATLLAALPQEHERGLGGWQAEAPVLAQLFALCHGALAAMVPVVEGLEVDTARMAANLAAADIGHDLGEARALTCAVLDQRKGAG